MKYYDDCGSTLYTYGDEYGASFVISTDSECSAHGIAMDESNPIEESDLPQAYGFYLMQCCKWNDKNSTAPWRVCSDHDDHGEMVSADILHCTGDRRVIGGEFDTKQAAHEYCMQYVTDHADDIYLVDGYHYQGNATGTGIVNAGHNEWLRESNADEATAFKAWLIEQESQE